MNDNKKKLDEMQSQNRNRIGNQMFIFMIFALYINTWLSSWGVTWLSYPANIMTIVTVCLVIYLVRLITANAYLPTSKTISKARVIIVAVIAIAVAVGSVIAFLQSSADIVAGSSQMDNGAIILAIVSGMGIVVAVIFALIKKSKDKNHDDD